MKRILGLLLALYVPAASAVYKCTDEKGLTLFGDTPPAACGNVPIYEMGPSGVVIRKIDPTPTPEQVKERAAEAARKAKAALAAADQRRKDMALLASYSSAQEFDVARDRNIEPVMGRIDSAQERMKELDKREEEIDTQLAGMKERSKNKDEFEPPAWLTANLDRVHKERAALTTGIARYKKEVEDLRAKYDGDKQRWILLKANAGTLASEAPAEAPKKDSKGY
jgi:hypothetical protein